MKVDACMTKTVFSCRPDTDMEEAARTMWEHDCGALPVVDEDGRVLGVVTDRDLCMGAYTRGRALRELRVGDSMSRELFACRPDDSLEQVVRTMSDHRVRRVPVLDDSGHLVGIVSMNDLVRHVTAGVDAPVRRGLMVRVVEAFASICEPRRPGVEAIEPMPARSGARAATSAGARR